MSRPGPRAEATLGLGEGSEDGCAVADSLAEGFPEAGPVVLGVAEGHLVELDSLQVQVDV